MNISLRIKQITIAIILIVALGLLFKFRNVLPIFILALLLAYILTPPVVWISSKRFFKKQISRGIAVILLYLVIISSVTFGGAYFVINLTNEIRILVKDIPTYSEQLSKNWVPAISKGVQNISVYLPKIQTTQIPEISDPVTSKSNLQTTKQQTDTQADIVRFFQNTRFEVKQNKNGFEIIPYRINKTQMESDVGKFDLAKHINDFVLNVTENLQSVLLGFLDFGQAVVITVISSIFQTFITLMIAAFIIIDHEKILNFFRGLFPNRFLSKVDSFLQKQNVGLHGVVRGQLIICLINGTLTAVGLIIFDVKFAVTLSMLATVTSLIPIFGVFISSIPIILMAITNSFVTGLLMLGWILLIHFIEGNILNPKIIGKSAEIHPVLVILALMAGQKTYGIFGALIAVPIFSILQTTFIFIREIVFAESSPLKELKSNNTTFDPADAPEKPIADD